MHAISLKCISGLAQHAPSSALLETLYPVMGAVPLLPGEALTEELAGSGQCLKLREFDIWPPKIGRAGIIMPFPCACHMKKLKPGEPK